MLTWEGLMLTWEGLWVLSLCVKVTLLTRTVGDHITGLPVAGILVTCKVRGRHDGKPVALIAGHLAVEQVGVVGSTHVFTVLWLDGQMAPVDWVAGGGGRGWGH